MVHPGRDWALAGILENSLDPLVIAERIQNTVERVPPRKDHAAQVEEMLATFRQDDHRKEAQPLLPPVGEDVPGPDPDEAGDEVECLTSRRNPIAFFSQFGLEVLSRERREAVQVARNACCPHSTTPETPSSTLATSPLDCRPSRITSTISGASSINLSTRLT